MPSDQASLPIGEAHRTALGARAVLLRGLACGRAAELVAAIDAITVVSPFRHMVTPGGWEMSVAMTNCGRAGRVTDRPPVTPLDGAQLITPPSTVAVLRGGYQPQIHASAFGESVAHMSVRFEASSARGSRLTICRVLDMFRPPDIV